MKLKLKMLYLLFFLLFSFCPKGYSQYAKLIGKWVEIHGPQYWDVIGMAVDEQSCEKLIDAYHADNTKIFNAVLKSFDVMRIDNNSQAIVLDTRILEGKARVLLFTGIYKGTSGWIPIEWLKGNEKRPRFSDDP